MVDIHEHAGRFGMVKASTTSGGSVLEVVGLNSWTLNRTRDKFEVTQFQSENKRYVVGLPDAQGNIAGFWRDDDTQLWAGADSEDGIDLELYPDFTNLPAVLASGPAWMDVSMTVPVNGANTVSGTWVAAGDFDTSTLHD